MLPETPSYLRPLDLIAHFCLAVPWLLVGGAFLWGSLNWDVPHGCTAALMVGAILAVVLWGDR